MDTYDVFHLPVLNWVNILYFFFGGLAAGSFLLSFWAGYEVESRVNHTLSGCLSAQYDRKKRGSDEFY